MTAIAKTLNTKKAAALIAAFLTIFAMLSVNAIPSSAAPSLKPTVVSVDNKRPAVAGGTQITVTGTNLGTVTSITVDNNYATIASKTAKSIVFMAPQHALGTATVLITNPAGTATFVVTYSPQRRALVPRPNVPETLKLGKSLTINGQDPTWTVTVTTDTPKVCSTKKNVVKALKRGSCSLTIDINPDTAAGSNPNWRAKQFQTGITIN
jgi:hypothetical protein